MLALGAAVGHGSTVVDDRFGRMITALVGENPRWLLVFTNEWLLAAVLVGCLAVAAHRRRWQLAVLVAALPVVAIATTAVLKPWFDRRNGPYLEYPSGHSTLVVVVLGMMVVVADGRRWALAVATAGSLLGMLGLVGCGYHYLTDTVGAALLGSALVCLAGLLAHRSRPVRGAVAVSAAVCVLGVGLPAAALAAPIDAREAGFIDVGSVLSDAVIDLRYATPNNFLHTPLYPVGARCLVHESLAPGLAVAADTLRGQGRTLVFWDCYRPHAVQARMFEAVPDPTWVARPGPFARSHVAGRSVDVTVAEPAARCPAARQLGVLCLLDMGTDFDDFSPRAAAFAADGISASAAANRAVLRDAMRAGGFAAYTGEWWHFDGPGAGVERPLVDIPVN